jgi:hypothetical protein
MQVDPGVPGKCAAALARAMRRELVTPRTRKEMVRAATAGVLAMDEKIPGANFVGMLWTSDGASLLLLPAGFKILPEAAAAVIDWTADELHFQAAGFRQDARKRHRDSAPLWTEASDNIRIINVPMPKRPRRKGPRPVDDVRPPRRKRKGGTTFEQLATAATRPARKLRRTKG